ncbi:MAG: hypothetical protein AAFZ52_13355, partial [Bacteroidota bacterium]
MKYLLACLLLLAGNPLVTAQQFRVTATEESELHQLSVTGEQEINVTVDGLAPGERFEVFIAEDRFAKLFTFGNVGGEVYRLHDDFISGMATGKSVDLCIAEELDHQDLLYLAVRKVRPTSPQQKLMQISTQASTNGDSLLNT